MPVQGGMSKEICLKKYVWGSIFKKVCPQGFKIQNYIRRGLVGKASCRNILMQI